MSEYQRRLCSNCGAALAFSESDPCDECREQAEFRGKLFGAIVSAGGIPVDLPETFDGGPDIVPLRPYERTNR